jgi:transcription-repair coupling factor (superfamily II helicase)
MDASSRHHSSPAAAPGLLTYGGAPEGFDAILIAEWARAKGTVLLLARDEPRAVAEAEALSFFAPDLTVLRFPGWDCLPYDRVSPKPEILSARMAALSHLAERAQAGTKHAPLIVIATVNAALQRVPPRAVVRPAVFNAKVGERLDAGALTQFLARNGYNRTGTVLEPGDFALRGGIIDIFPPGQDQPYRLDLFGDELETIRRFDPASQRSAGEEKTLTLVPASEVLLDEASIARFRAGYRAAFGAVTDDDPLYEAISAGRKHLGMEHWLPLFYEKLETLFDYLPGALRVLDHQLAEAHEARLSTIADYFEARQIAREAPKAGTLFGGSIYKPLPPASLYLEESEWQSALAQPGTRALSPFTLPPAPGISDAGGRAGRDFAPERAQENVNVFDAVAAHIKALEARGLKVILASWSAGARERLEGVLKDHHAGRLARIEHFAEAAALAAKTVALAVLSLEHGFETDRFAIIAEQDILGDRLLRSRAKRRRAAEFIADAGSLEPGDFVVHIDHGVGRFEGLQTLQVQGEPHDCLLILYQGGSKLYLPVENIELLSRFGGSEAEVELDRLGGTGWQNRKARLKKRLRDIAEHLIKLAAARELRPAPRIVPSDGLYEEFCARFPYDETEDQRRAIGDVLDDLGKGRPMDRLICGDVGFGKTEVALRAAFVTAMSGKQVALIVPTTLLARQHFRTFSQRFAGLPVKLCQLSRLVPAAQAAETKAGLQSGDVDIVIGTHALLGKGIAFRDLALLIVDEEQHFGVKHKERLKALRADVHVLTLTATPIPRTLQLALSGVREMSVIATPPVDRLAVRSFVSPFDAVVVREALLREHYRGGQSFFVCPRIADLTEIAEFLREQVPEVKTVVAHGQMAPTDLETVMNAFYDGQYDVLLSTTIVESGLDIPTANTLVVHRADMFGLSQLYQLRGRIGRAKQRAYAYLTYPPRRQLTIGAERRLQVLQSLDTLGAGFNLASHDLDIRGAGNLLGEEQSGHIREVGIELYQSMLEEAVAALREGGTDVLEEGQWSPQINIGTAVLIPESYVGDLDLRMSLYRRLARLESEAEIDDFAAELIDRFGPLPQPVEDLLVIVSIKRLCRMAGVAKIDAGPKGATVSFRNNSFANPAGLVLLINRHQTAMKARPDQTLVVLRSWPEAADRLAGVLHLLKELAKIAAAA